ncbi:unnamed protein product [Laminaria digitata]
MHAGTRVVQPLQLLCHSSAPVKNDKRINKPAKQTVADADRLSNFLSSSSPFLAAQASKAVWQAPRGAHPDPFRLYARPKVRVRESMHAAANTFQPHSSHWGRRDGDSHVERCDGDVEAKNSQIHLAPLEICF